MDHFLGLIKSKMLKLTLPIIKCTSLFYSVSCFQSLRISSRRHVEAHNDPTLVPNLCWDQKMDHLLGLIKSKMSKLTLPIIKCTSLFYSVSCFNTLLIASKRNIDAYYHPTLDPNGYWDQKIGLFPLVCSSCSSRSFLLAFWLSRVYAIKAWRAIKMSRIKKIKGSSLFYFFIASALSDWVYQCSYEIK